MAFARPALVPSTVFHALTHPYLTLDDINDDYAPEPEVWRGRIESDLGKSYHKVRPSTMQNEAQCLIHTILSPHESLDLSWNYAAESQAYDRVHRLGQEKEVFVKRLVVNNTLEER